MCKISVIVPVYKVEKYLNRCVESLVRQTLRGIEIILVDDASPDGSGRICDQWVGRNDLPEGVSIIVVHHEKNRRAAGARNSGLKVATGEFVGFVDADDHVDHRMYEQMVSAAEASGADVVQCGYCAVSSDGRETVVHVDESISCEGLASSPQLIRRQSKFVWDKIFRRNMLERESIKFREGIIFYEDYWFLAEVDVALRRFTVVDYPGYVYFVRREGSTTTTFDRRLLDCTYVFGGICELIKRNGIWEQVSGEVFYNAVESFRLRVRDFNSYSNWKLQRDVLVGWEEFFDRYYSDWRKKMLPLIGSRADKLLMAALTIRPISILWISLPCVLRKALAQSLKIIRGARMKCS